MKREGMPEVLPSMPSVARKGAGKPVRQPLPAAADDRPVSVPLVNWLLLVAYCVSAGLLLLALIGLWLSMAR